MSNKKPSPSQTGTMRSPRQKASGTWPKRKSKPPNNTTAPSRCAHSRGPGMNREQLGAPGPYMICAVCNTPLDRYSLVEPDNPSDEDSDSICYTHGWAVTDEDHPPVPTPGTPIEADTLCDFCHAPDPRYAFVPRKAIRVRTPDGGIHDYSSPWSSCGTCLQPAKKRDMTALLDRAMNSPHGSAHQAPLAHRRVVRSMLRQLYSALFRSAPAGPYEAKLRDENPLGKRRGRRGMS